MTPTILLGLIALVPVLVILFLRADAAIVFLSLSAGSVLVKYVGPNAVTTISTVTDQNNAADWTYVGLLLLPMVLSMFLLKHTVSSAKLPINILPAMATGILTALLLVPLLPGGISADIMRSSTWGKVEQYQDLIVASCILTTLLILWFGHTLSRHRGHRKKHH